MLRSILALAAASAALVCAEAAYAQTDGATLPADAPAVVQTETSDVETKASVMLSCTVRADFSLTCAAVSETPEGLGYGDAAVKIARTFKIKPDSGAKEGDTIKVPIKFRADP